MTIYTLALAGVLLLFLIGGIGGPTSSLSGAHQVARPLGGLLNQSSPISVCPGGCTALNYNNSSGYTSLAPCTSYCGPIGPTPYPSPPQPARTASPRTLSTHYYVGSYFSGTSYTASYVYSDLGTPSSGPHYGDFYYVLLSAWDTGGHYDQLGMASDYCPTTLYTFCQGVDTWTLSWSVGTSSTPGCSISYNYTPNAASLLPDTTYTYEMKLTGSYLDLYVYTGGLGGTLVWSNTNSISDSAANFNVDASYSCNGVNEVGYTGYEEVYNIATSQSFPQWDFQFANAFGGGSRIQSWGTLAQATSPYTLPTSPHGYYMDYTAGNYFIRIANEAVWIAFPWDAPVIAQGGGFTDNGYLIAIGSASPTQACTGNPTCKYTLAWTIPNNPTTWNANAIQSSIYVPATLSFSATSYSTTTPGLYYAVCVLTITSFSVNEVTSYIWYIYVT